MGQDFVVSQRQHPSTLLAHLQQPYSAEPHPLYPNSPYIQLLRHANQPEHFVVRIKASNNESEQIMIETQIRNRNQYKYAHLTTMKHHYQQVIEGYCGNLHKYYIIFYVAQHRTLKDELQKPKHFMQTEQQLLIGLHSLIYGIIQTKHNKLKHDNITASSVYIIEQKLVLADPEIAPHNPQSRCHYYSPQKLQCLRNELHQYDVYASDLFSIGLVILEASKGAKLEKVYKTQDMGINYDVLIEEIDKCKFQNLRNQLKFLLLSNEYHRKQYFLELQQSYLKQLLQKNQDKQGKVVSNKILFLGGKVKNKKEEVSKKIIEPQSNSNDRVSRFINQKPNESYANNAKSKNIPINKSQSSYHIVVNGPPQPQTSFSKQAFSKDKHIKSTGYIEFAPPQRAKSTAKVNFQYQNYKPPTIDSILRKVENYKPYNNKLQTNKPTYHTSTSILYFDPINSFSSHKLPLLQNLDPQLKPMNHQEWPRVEGIKGAEGIRPSNSQRTNVEVSQFDKTLSLSKQLGYYYSKLTEFGGKESKSQQIQFNVVGPGKISNTTNYQQEEESFIRKFNNNHENYIKPTQQPQKHHQIQQDTHRNQSSHIYSQQISEQHQNVRKTGSAEAEKNSFDLLNKFSLHSYPQQSQLEARRQSQAQTSQIMEEVNRSMESQNLNHSYQDVMRMNQIYGTQLQTVSNLQIPQQASSQEESFDSKLERPQQSLSYFQEEYENGGIYKGYMLINGNIKQRQGHGCFYYREGGYYEGNWRSNKMNGFGKLYYDNGKIAYEGQWFMDEFHGRGKIFNDSPDALHGSFNYKNFADMDKYWQFYEGDIAHDAKEGYGKLIFSNGQYYVGQFKNDRPGGRGHFYSSLKIIHGLWVNGNLMKQL